MKYIVIEYFDEIWMKYEVDIIFLFEFVLFFFGVVDWF